MKEIKKNYIITDEKKFNEIILQYGEDNFIRQSEVSVYYGTPRKDLQRNNMSLCVILANDFHPNLLCIRTNGYKDNFGNTIRDEWQYTLSSANLDLTVITDSMVRTMLCNVRQSALHETFKTDVKRYVINLQNENIEKQSKKDEDKNKEEIRMYLEMSLFYIPDLNMNVPFTRTLGMSLSYTGYSDDNYISLKQSSENVAKKSYGISFDEGYGKSLAGYALTDKYSDAIINSRKKHNISFKMLH